MSKSKTTSAAEQVIDQQEAVSEPEIITESVGNNLNKLVGQTVELTENSIFWGLPTRNLVLKKLGSVKSNFQVGRDFSEHELILVNNGLKSGQIRLTVNPKVYDSVKREEMISNDTLTVKAYNILDYTDIRDLRNSIEECVNIGIIEQCDKIERLEKKRKEVLDLIQLRFERLSKEK